MGNQAKLRPVAISLRLNEQYFIGRMLMRRERLTRASPSPVQVHRVYRQAHALCEAPTMRERRALLLLGLDFLPGVSSQVQLFRLLAKDGAGADVV